MYVTVARCQRRLLHRTRWTTTTTTRCSVEDSSGASRAGRRMLGCSATSRPRRRRSTWMSSASNPHTRNLPS
eukprot:756813-Hanusia_phi.AAC.1